MPGLLDTRLRFWPESPWRVRAELMVWVPEAGKVIVLAVVSSRSRVSKVLLPVMVRAAEPVAMWRRVP